MQEIYELKQTGDKVRAASICRHSLGSDAVMNCASFYDGRNFVIACGQEEKCCLYSVKYKVVMPTKTGAGNYGSHYIYIYININSIFHRTFYLVYK